MCGITGVFHTNNKAVEQKLLHRMDSSLVHRGPDGHGEFIYRNMGIANRRLAIIDPTPEGNQPLGTSDHKMWITFNGEIFNYKEIRRYLIQRGYKFKTGTDTEVVLYGYKHFGDEIAKKLIGQFSFCISDLDKKEMFLARDQIGVNPLYYSWVDGTFLFASEVKAILASHLVKKELDPLAVSHYVSMFVVPAPLTVLKHVHSLLPGHFMRVGKNGLQIKQFYDVPIGHWRNERVPRNELESLLREEIIASVKRSMVSDVPVGLFLSGGVDSSTVFALMSRYSKNPVNTYSLWGEGGDAYDERKYISMMTGKYKSKHTSFTVTQEEVVKSLPQIVYYFDQPTGGSMEVFFISKKAVRDVKVVLSGLGGDELFGGYHSYIHKTQTAGSLYRKLPRFFSLPMLNAIKRLPVSDDLKATIKKGEKFLNLPTVLKQRLFLYFAYQDEEKKRLFNSEFIRGALRYTTEGYFENISEDVKLHHPIDQLEYLDLKTYTRDDLLMGMNMMSMASSLEARVPLLDPKLIALAAKIPPDLKYKNGISKYILKNVVSEWVPRDILTHKKTGFGLPRIKYMTGMLKPHIMSVLSRQSVEKRGIFNPDFVQTSLNSFYETNQNRMLWSEHLRVWLLFVLELWCRIYIDGTVIEPPSASLTDLV
jgi:asparagine synthase (glutamine-hydrolysing)